MSQVIKIKSSSTPASVPDTTDVILGELAVNTYDGKLYMKKDDGSEEIVEVGGFEASQLSDLVSYQAVDEAAVIAGTTIGGESITHVVGQVWQTPSSHYTVASLPVVDITDLNVYRYADKDLLESTLGAGSVGTLQNGTVQGDITNATRELNTGEVQYVFDDEDVPYGFQSICEDPLNATRLFALSLSSNATLQRSTVHRYTRNSVMTSATTKSGGSGEIIGHQGLFCNLDGTDQILTGTAWTDKRHVVHATFQAGAEFTNVSYHVAYDNTFASSLSCTPSQSRDKLSYITQGSKSGLRWIREWSVADDSLISETTYDTSLLNGHPVQGMAIDGDTIYIVAGNTTSARDKVFMKVRKVTGDILYYNPRFAPFYDEGKNVYDAIYEPEGMSWIEGDLFLIMITGLTSVNRRTFAINLTSPTSGPLRARLLGNLLSTIQSNATQDREYLSIRAGKDLSEGSGLNIYGSGDTTGNALTIFKADGSGASAATFQDKALRGPSSTDFTVQALGGDMSVTAPSGSSVRIKGEGGLTLLQCGSPEVLINSTNVDTVRPTSNNICDLGDSSRRFKTIYLVNAPAVTSDERLKTPLVSLEDKVLDAWENVGWSSFKLHESIAEKGEENARIHVGVGAQTVIAKFEEQGLDAMDFAFIRLVTWESSEAVYDSDGVLEQEAVVGGSRYEIVYEEALALEAALMRREMKRMKEGYYS